MIQPNFNSSGKYPWEIHRSNIYARGLLIMDLDSLRTVVANL